MTHPKQYLLEKIVGYKTNGFASLGELNGKHVDDIVKLMTGFAEETVLDAIERVNDGKTTLLIKDKLIRTTKRNSIIVKADKL